MTGISVFLLATFLGYLLFKRFQVSWELKKLGKMSVNEQTQAYFWGILDLVSHCHHLSLDQGETPQAYSHRVGKRFAFANQTVYMRDLATMYNKAKFGVGELTEGEFKIMKQSYFDMIAFMKSIRIRPHYIYLRYIERIGAIIRDKGTNLEYLRSTYREEY